MAEIATQCDLRQGAIHDSLPFQDDPLKKLFYKALLEKADLLHFTVLKVGSSVLSAHLGLIDKHKHRVQVDVFSHSVSHARHSPGMLHILMLGLRLLKDGIAVLDLTPPGGDYKERFASTHDEVFILTMYGSRKQLWSAGITKAAVASVKTALDVLGIPHSTVRTLVEEARRFSGFGLVGNLKRFWFHRRPVRLYRYEFVPAQLGDVTTVMSRDRLGDLLAFEPKQTWSTDRQGFLASACKRLEKGHHCYTYIDHCSLVCCGWLVERYEAALLLDLSPRFQIPKGSALLVDCNINPQAREIGLFESCVKQMLHDARLVSGTHYAYVSVLADDGPALRAIEKLGFVYQGSPGLGPEKCSSLKDGF
jgi:Acetyltransferase (GNAT) domain